MQPRPADAEMAFRKAIRPGALQAAATPNLSSRMTSHSLDQISHRLALLDVREAVSTGEKDTSGISAGFLLNVG